MPIQVEHLTHTYLPGSPFSATAIHDITLTIQDGEFVGILGHTGSGKTTLVQHLNGLLKPTEGRVVIDGKDITRKGVSLLDVRRQVGLVFQYPEYQLFEETVAKDVAFGPKNMGLSRPEIDERVRWAIGQVGLEYEAVAECSPFELSGGQMRRVAIAGVLAMRPKTLILDEPTAGLDPRGRRSILGMISRLHAENHMTVLMVSHNMDDIASLATRLVVMSKGELIMTGVPREVFRQREILRAVGLGVPQGAELCHRLREAGYPVPEGLYTLSEARDAILRLAGRAVPGAETAAPRASETDPGVASSGTGAASAKAGEPAAAGPSADAPPAGDAPRAPETDPGVASSATGAASAKAGEPAAESPSADAPPAGDAPRAPETDPAGQPPAPDAPLSPAAPGKEANA